MRVQTIVDQKLNAALTIKISVIMVTYWIRRFRVITKLLQSGCERNIFWEKGTEGRAGAYDCRRDVYAALAMETKSGGRYVSVIQHMYLTTNECYKICVYACT